MDNLKHKARETIKRKNRSIKTKWTLLAFMTLAAFFALPSSLGTLAAQDSGGDGLNVEITFTKWVTTVPDMAGIVGGDVGTGTFAGEILNFVPGPDITTIEALYHITGETHSFSAHVFVRQNEVTQTAVITGEVTDGWLKERHVRGNYTVISCPDQTNEVCFQGTLHAMVEAQDDAEAQAKYANAMSAAPMSIAQDATVLDNAVDANGKNIVLQEGTNGWTCFPDDLTTPMNNPACYDEVWMTWIAAATAGDDPSLTVNRPGFSYMLQGDDAASNFVPFAAEPAEGEMRMASGPHIMILFPPSVDISSVTTDEHSSYWVMWPGTPYQHIMILTADMDMEAIH